MIEVNEWQLNSNIELGLEGELTERITNAKVYVNDDLLGIFEVPFRIPVLKSGPCNVKIPLSSIMVFQQQKIISFFKSL